MYLSILFFSYVAASLVARSFQFSFISAVPSRGCILQGKNPTKYSREISNNQTIPVGDSRKEELPFDRKRPQQNQALNQGLRRRLQIGIVAVVGLHAVLELPLQ